MTNDEFLPPDSTHLFSPTGGMHIRLETDAFSHGVCKVFKAAIAGAQDTFNIDLAPVKQARPQQPIRRETQPIARRAKRSGHGADKTETPNRPSIS